MSLSQLDNDLGVLVLMNGPTPDKITRSFWANNAGRRKQLLAFGVMPGFLFDEEGKKVVEPMLESLIKLIGSITGMQQEFQGKQPLADSVNLTVRVEQEVKGVKPLPQFRASMAFTNVLAPGARLCLSYNVKTRMGGIALNGQRHLVTAQDYWRTRLADGWLVAAEPSIKGIHAEPEDNAAEQSNTAW